MNYYNTLFVFRRSIDETDVPRGELISLIELQKEDLVIKIFEEEYFFENFQSKNSNFYSFNDELTQVIDYNFAFLIFFSQSALLISNYDLNIKEMIRRAGYIHSCGKFLFVTKWKDLELKKIVESVKDFCTEEKKWYEAKFYKKSENKNYNSLNSILIDDKRYHIGKSSFSSASSELDTELKDISFKTRFEEGEGHIFIIKETGKVQDNSVLSDLYSDRGNIDYAICYLSEYKKDNTIHEIDNLKESKPYWGGIFTTPHQLMNAMLNLAKVDEDSVILDPFCHTGTLTIEASQIGCKVISCDLAGTIGAEDNYNFLCKGHENFHSLVHSLNETSNNEILTNQFKEIFPTCVKKNAQGLPETDNNYASSLGFVERLYFYILRRYYMENQRGADLPPTEKQFVENYISGYTDKDGKLIPGYNLFSKQLKVFEEANKQDRQPIVSTSSCMNFQEIFPDSYYKTKRVGYINKTLDEKLPSYKTKNIIDGDYEIAENSIDAIVTDPPYGYGEGLSKEQVTIIYSSFIEKSFTWLKPQGYLVFCALDKVKTGRKDDLIFTEDILNLVNTIARKRKIKFIMSDILLTNRFFFNIYYWKSKSALNRSIISLRIIK